MPDAADLTKRFPGMKPIAKAPLLYTFNGFGFTVYGSRNRDHKTNTYVKSHCLTALFVPILFLGAYRTADAEKGGWYFVGKESLSLVTKLWNVFVVTSIIVFSSSFFWNQYKTSPEYIAKQQLSEARSLAASGEKVKALTIYCQLLVNQELYIEEVQQEMIVVTEDIFSSDSGSKIAKALDLIGNLPEQYTRSPFIPNIHDRSLNLIKKFKESDPKGAYSILKSLAKLSPISLGDSDIEMDLLQRMMTAEPDNPEPAVSLALLYESEDKLDKCESLLMPYIDRLGTSEGARILGNIMVSQNKNDEAYNLLSPYVESRLVKFQNAINAYEKVYKDSNQAAITFLNQGLAPESFYQTYEKSDQEEQGRLVNEYILKHIQSDPSVISANDRLAEFGRIVPVALDLGIIQLSRAQNLSDPADRQGELEAAEKTFLSIRGIAGETDEYRLFLGQVYYWLGKHKEGKELFDDLLEANKRHFLILMSLANTLREIGETKTARDLAEEAYNKGDNDNQRYEAATFLYLVAPEIEDKIAWLKKSDPKNQSLQNELNYTLGLQAMEDGHDAAAVTYFKKSIEGYENTPENATVLNNCSLVYSALYQITGDKQDFQRSVQMLEKSLALNPSDSIILMNTMNGLVDSAVLDIIDEAIDLKILKQSISISFISYLYSNADERKAIISKLATNPNLSKALSYLDKIMVLAPKNLNSYTTGVSIYSLLQDERSLNNIFEKFSKAEIDLSELKSDSLDYYSGAKDKEYQKVVTINLSRYEERLRSGTIATESLTYAVLLDRVINSKMGQFRYGAEIEGSKLIALAESSVRIHRNSATMGTLISCLFFKGAQDLAKQNSEFRNEFDHTRRSLDAQMLVAYILEQNGPLLKIIKGNKEISRALEMQLEYSRAFPKTRRISDWALFKVINPAEAKDISEAIMQNKADHITTQLTNELNAFSAATILNQYWRLKMVGDVTRANDIFQAAVNAGIPLPTLL